MKLLPLLLLAALLLAPGPGRAQGKYMTKLGKVSFFSTSLIEDIEATNTATAAVFDLSTGQLAFAVPIKQFQFKRTLMQEHFNENYLESDKYPRATFTGQFAGVGPGAAELAGAGAHAVRVEGDLTIHGVTHHLAVPGTLELKNGQLLAAAVFNVAPADYAIEIPLLVRNNIAKIVSIRVALACDAVGGNPPPAPRAAPSR